MGAKGIGPRSLGVSPIKQTKERKNAVTIDGNVSRKADNITANKNISAVSGGVSYKTGLLNASLRGDSNKNYSASLSATNKKGNISGGLYANSNTQGKSVGGSFTLKF